MREAGESGAGMWRDYRALRLEIMRRIPIVELYSFLFEYLLSTLGRAFVLKSSLLPG
jgi:hypothetical protein